MTNELIYYIGVALWGVLCFFVKRLIGDYDRLKKTMFAQQDYYRAEIAKIRDEYLKNEEFVRFQMAIDAKLTKIYEILVGR